MIMPLARNSIVAQLKFESTLLMLIKFVQSVGCIDAALMTMIFEYIIQKWPVKMIP